MSNEGFIDFKRALKWVEDAISKVPFVRLEQENEGVKQRDEEKR